MVGRLIFNAQKVVFFKEKIKGLAEIEIRDQGMVGRLIFNAQKVVFFKKKSRASQKSRSGTRGW